MKVGDKIYCIKEKTEKCWNVDLDDLIKRTKDLSDDELKQLFNELDTKATQSTQFTNGKAYKISSILGNSIKIVGDDKTGHIFSSEFKPEELRTGALDGAFFSEFFVSEKEYRRMKLQTLSDENFSSFLKRIKKK